MQHVSIDDPGPNPSTSSHMPRFLAQIKGSSTLSSDTEISDIRSLYNSNIYTAMMGTEDVVGGDRSSLARDIYEEIEVGMRDVHGLYDSTAGSMVSGGGEESVVSGVEALRRAYCGYHGGRSRAGTRERGKRDEEVEEELCRVRLMPAGMSRRRPGTLHVRGNGDGDGEVVLNIRDTLLEWARGAEYVEDGRRESDGRRPDSDEFFSAIMGTESEVPARWGCMGHGDSDMARPDSTTLGDDIFSAITGSRSEVPESREYLENHRHQSLEGEKEYGERRTLLGQDVSADFPRPETSSSIYSGASTFSEQQECEGDGSRTPTGCDMAGLLHSFSGPSTDSQGPEDTIPRRMSGIREEDRITPPPVSLERPDRRPALGLMTTTQKPRKKEALEDSEPPPIPLQSPGRRISRPTTISSTPTSPRLATLSPRPLYSLFPKITATPRIAPLRPKHKEEAVDADDYHHHLNPHCSTATSPALKASSDLDQQKWIPSPLSPKIRATREASSTASEAKTPTSPSSKTKRQKYDCTPVFRIPDPSNTFLYFDLTPYQLRQATLHTPPKDTGAEEQTPRPQVSLRGGGNDAHKLIGANKQISGARRPADMNRVDEEFRELRDNKRNKVAEFSANTRYSQFLDPDTKSTRVPDSGWNLSGASVVSRKTFPPPERKVVKSQTVFEGMQTVDDEVEETQEDIRQAFMRTGRRIIRVKNMRIKKVLENDNLTAEEKTVRVDELEDIALRQVIEAKHETGYEHVDDETAIREALSRETTVPFSNIQGSSSAVPSGQPGHPSATQSATRQATVESEPKRKSRWDIAKKVIRSTLALPDEDDWELKSYSRTHPPTGYPPVGHAPIGYGSLVAFNFVVDRSGPPKRRLSKQPAEERSDPRASVGASSQNTIWPVLGPEDYPSVPRKARNRV